MNTSIEPIRTYAGVAVYSVCDVLDESLPNWTGGAHWSPQGQYDAIRAWCKRNDAEFYETSAEYFNWRAAVGQAHESGKAAVVISNLS